MSLKVVVLFAFLAVAYTEKPDLGFRMPPLDLIQVEGSDMAQKSSYPFIASLQWGGNEHSLSHVCSASILNENWLVTAAHCILAVSPGLGVFVAKVGKHNIKTSEDTGQIVEIAKAYVHEKYSGTIGLYDIGLLKVKTPLKFTEDVQPIGLPEAGSEPKGTPILVEWATSQNSIQSTPDKLQHVNLKYISRQKCNRTIKRLIGLRPVYKTNICTVPVTDETSICHTDTGGALFEKSSAGAKLTGIVSFGNLLSMCRISGMPSVYIKTSMFVDWIQDIIDKE